jgi:hypothetical protein
VRCAFLQPAPVTKDIDDREKGKHLALDPEPELNRASRDEEATTTLYAAGLSLTHWQWGKSICSLSMTSIETM